MPRIRKSPLRMLAAPVVASIMLGLAVSVGAVGPFNDEPAGPRSLPGDRLPPFAMLDETGALPPPPPLPPGARHPGHGNPPSPAVPGPDLDHAMALALAALRACEADGYRVEVAVIDSQGEPRAMLASDGSSGSVFVAARKAIVSLEFAMTSSQAAQAIESNPDLRTRVTPAMFVVGGAVPIVQDGEVIGALGVSGAVGAVVGQQDEACANAALGASLD